jgi:hypothetical protein
MAFGISRITLSRQLSLEELIMIRKQVPGIDLEILILNIGCNFINGFCRMHRLVNLLDWSFRNCVRRPALFRRHLPSSVPLCKTPFEIAVYKENKIKKIKKEVYLGNPYAGCGACAIPILDTLPIQGLKIVGRGFPLERKIKDISFIKSILGYLRENKGITLNAAIPWIRDNYKKIYDKECDFKKQCHLSFAYKF